MTLTKKLRRATRFLATVKNLLHQLGGIIGEVAGLAKQSARLITYVALVIGLVIALAPGVLASSKPVDGAAPNPTAQHVTVDVYLDADSCARPAP